MLINSFCILHLHWTSFTPPLQKDLAHPSLLWESSTHPALCSSQTVSSGNIKSIFSRPILPYQLQSLPSLWLDSQCPHFILLHDSHPPNSTAYWKTFFQEFLARSSAVFLETVHKEVRITHCCALTLSCQMTNWCAVWLCSPFSDIQTHSSASSHTSARESPLFGWENEQAQEKLSLKHLMYRSLLCLKMKLLMTAHSSNSA